METERDRLIREKAYELWEQRGRPEGQSDEHWHEAASSFGRGSEDPMAVAPADAGAATGGRKRAVKAKSSEASAETAATPPGKAAANPKSAATKSAALAKPKKRT